ncbi:MAG: CDP-alcohol phosphatidyltransferase family protein [Planctomycetes bacterium]|nr:CDP-alcohol phosphatidyltransferase family protein [Planctomycetota bacterium]
MIESAQQASGKRPRLGWLPDALSLSRIPMAALCWLAVPDSGWTLALMAAAGVSDMLDGFAARKLGGNMQRGAWLDPLCDKAFVLSLLVALGVKLGVPWWWLTLIALRELIQVPLLIAYKIVHRLRPDLTFNFRAGIPGKIATIAQFLAVLALIMHWEALPFIVAAAVIGAMAAAHYILRAAKLARHQGQV